VEQQGQSNPENQPAPPAGDEPELVPAALQSHRRLRVGWVAGPETLDLYGRSLQPLAIGLLDEVIDVAALCPQQCDVQELPSPPIEILRYGKRRWRLLSPNPIEVLADEMQRRRVDLLHALDCDAWPMTARLARLAGRHCILSSYSLDDARRLGHLGDGVAAVLAASDPIQVSLAAHRVTRPERIQLLRPGVYQVRHATCFQDPSYRVSIIAGGDLDDFAAFDAVVKCFGQLRDRKYDCVFFILGNGRAEKSLRASAERLGIRHELTFVDQQPARSLPGIFKAADIYISPVANRGLDMACLLAMAAGVPVLAAAEGASDFLAGDKIVTRFNQGDATDLTRKLTGLMDNHAAAKEIAERALTHLRAHHSPARVVAALTEVYRRVAEMPKPSPALQTV
jgi:glycosyltransferase involved in cell wall biosynthesis